MNRQHGLTRLRSLREHSQLTSEHMAEERGRFAALAGRHESGTAPRAVSAFNLFQTPEEITQEMARTLAEAWQPNQSRRVLEPSAGLGRLVDSCLKEWEVVAVEQSLNLVEELNRKPWKHVEIHQGDFLETDVNQLGGLFDGVIMNPPFKLGRDIKHIRHAYKMLKPGGLLVSLCFNGVRQNNQLRPEVDSWEVLPSDSFKSEGTRASIALITWQR